MTPASDQEQTDGRTPDDRLDADGFRSRTHQGPMTLAHRGASGYVPENTLLAISTAVSAGADYVEVDVQGTSDGIILLCHDRNLRRTTNVEDVFPERAEDRIATFRYDELRQLDAGSWNDPAFAESRIPTLNQALTELHGTGCGLLIEIKRTKIVAQLARELAEFLRINPGFPIAVGSVKPHRARQFHRLLPDVPVGVLFVDEDDITEADIAAYSEFASFLGFRNDVISAAIVQVAHASGLKAVHNTNTRLHMDQSAANGADGTMTDFPDRKFRSRLGLPTEVFEGEDLSETAVSSATISVRTQAELHGIRFKLSGGADLCVTGSSADDWLDVAFRTTTAGHRVMRLVLTGGPNGGEYDILLDGTRIIEGLDSYHPAPSRTALTIDVGNMAMGRHVLRFRMVGKNACSGGYFAGIDVFALDQPDTFDPVD